MKVLKVRYQDMEETGYVPDKVDNEYEWLKEWTNFFMKYFAHIPSKKEVEIEKIEDITCYEFMKANNLTDNLTDFIEDDQLVSEIEQDYRDIAKKKISEDSLEDCAELMIGYILM